MNTLPGSRLLLLTCAVVTLVFGLTAARADEPVEDVPPPPKADAPKADAPKADAPKADAPKADAPKADASGWSAPAVTPGVGSPLGALPPPQIVRRRSGRPVAPRTAQPVDGQPRPAAKGPTATATGRIVTDVPDARTSAPPVTRPLRSALPAGAQPPAVPPRPPPPTGDLPVVAAPGVRAPGGAVGLPVGTGGSRVISVSKTHNVSIANPGTGEKDLALRIDVDYELVGQSGREVYVAIWFARADSGALIRSGVPDYGDGQGHVTLQTRSARVNGNSARFAGTLQIPYRAFPVASGEDAYDVEARVQVLRAETGGRVSVLCRGMTSFRVYGFSE